MLAKLRQLITGRGLDDLPPDEVLSRCLATVDAGVPDDLFQQLNRLKSDRVPRENTDYLRARCFLSRGNQNSAVEALKEELRYFPGNARAAALLAELHPSTQGATSLGSAEFQELFAQLRPYTMVGELRLLSLYERAIEVCRQDLPGNFVECGVAAGGGSALLAAVIARHSRRPRKHYAFDTFEGMPDPGDNDRHGKKAAADGGWGAGTCAAPESSLMEAARLVGAAEVVVPVKGLFADTLPRTRQEIGPVAFLHMDGDWYSSTMDILEHLYDQVVPGAPVQIDDYGYWQGCKKAIAEFESRRKVHFDLATIDSTGVWFRKG